MTAFDHWPTRMTGEAKQPALRLSALAMAALAAAFVPSAASAQGRAAGMVLELDGAATPAVAPYAELAARSTTALQPTARMSFIHYGTCRLVTVTGGRLYLDARRYSLAGGRVVSEEKTDCPREQKLATAGDGAVVAAGVVMRGAGGTPHLTDHPRIVLTGDKGTMFRAAELRRDGQAIGPMTVNGHLASWPADKPALAPGQGYVARLSSTDGKRTVDFVFSVAEPGVPGVAAAILRLD
jgi:hypothetical protein